MVRKKPVSSRIDHDTHDALERFADVYNYSRSEALAALVSDGLKDRGYIDDRTDPLEDVPTLTQRLIAHTFDLTLLIAITLLVDVLSSFAGRPIEAIPPRPILIAIAVILVGLNILAQYSRRKRIPGLIREVENRTRHRYRRRAGEATRSVLERVFN